jgi:hypothetical protein
MSFWNSPRISAKCTDRYWTISDLAKSVFKAIKHRVCYLAENSRVRRPSPAQFLTQSVIVDVLLANPDVACATMSRLLRSLIFLSASASATSTGSLIAKWPITI